MTESPFTDLERRGLALAGVDTAAPDAVVSGLVGVPGAAAASGPRHLARSAIDGGPLARIQLASGDDAARAAAAATAAFAAWRSVPAPVRGRLVQRIAERARDEADAIAALITLEVGKIPAEARGEVQEWLDVCDLAVGLSRQLHGLTIASERPDHRMMEQWHPLGPVACITAFNFPCAVWAWNAMIALVAGDAVVWKPSEKAPLTALACHGIAVAAMRDVGAPDGLLALVVGDADAGRALAKDRRFPLVSATGSVAMGRAVGATVAQRLGRTLLELGGNNALIVQPSADLELAAKAIVFAAVGTCGQRCTSLRRLLVHEDVAAELVARLRRAYGTLPIGDPRAPGILVGPLIDEPAANAMAHALAAARAQGGEVLAGGGRLTAGLPPGAYVAPALVRVAADAPVVMEETFAPILYVSTFRELDDAIAANNAVPQGLSSAIFTNDLREAERFLSATGSDCGIANVNIGTSGAEIGGAFGGEKDTGGGRESGSDAWKQYMRRVTNTVNYGRELPLAQGIRFDAD
ncbi:MAG: aldehyde dehydrogenase family protein [Deltaproteobacteria bacterium]|nr:aldehyde dehydrogenase family protein [Deltaproteobacteria bacterium]